MNHNRNKAIDQLNQEKRVKENIHMMLIFMGFFAALAAAGALCLYFIVHNK